jgi:hypothetical protein
MLLLHEGRFDLTTDSARPERDVRHDGISPAASCAGYGVQALPPAQAHAPLLDLGWAHTWSDKWPRRHRLHTNRY